MQKHPLAASAVFFAFAVTGSGEAQLVQRDSLCGACTDRGQ